MVDMNIIRDQDKTGNDKADEAAEQGVKLKGQDIVNLGARFAARQRSYVQLVKISMTTSYEHIVPEPNSWSRNRRRGSYVGE